MYFLTLLFQNTTVTKCYFTQNVDV